MRRAFFAIVLLIVAGASGCITPDDKRQWNEAFGDLRQDNIKNIALIAPRKSE